MRRCDAIFWEDKKVHYHCQGAVGHHGSHWCYLKGDETDLREWNESFVAFKKRKVSEEVIGDELNG